MNSIFKIPDAIRRSSTNSSVDRLADKLEENTAQLAQARYELEVEKNRASQTDGSPYRQDREYHKKEAIKGNAIEQKWREGPKSIAQQAEIIYKEMTNDPGATREYQGLNQDLNRKKLNII